MARALVLLATVQNLFSPASADPRMTDYSATLSYARPSNFIDVFAYDINVSISNDGRYAEKQESWDPVKKQYTGMRLFCNGASGRIEHYSYRLESEFVSLGIIRSVPSSVIFRTYRTQLSDHQHSFTMGELVTCTIFPHVPRT
jgi:hypothetical protein